VSQSVLVACSGNGVVRITCEYCVLWYIVCGYRVYVKKIFDINISATVRVLEHGRRTSLSRELVCKMLSYVKREAGAICLSVFVSLSAPPAFFRASHFSSKYSCFISLRPGFRSRPID
jgi:hypothetical protein